MGPLRKIVAETYITVGDVDIDADLLECGHVVMAPLDRNGHVTSAVRRRCRLCASR